MKGLLDTTLRDAARTAAGYLAVTAVMCLPVLALALRGGA